MSSGNGRSKNGGQRNSVPNEAPQGITEFFKEFLATSEYRHNLKKRILAGEANHMEILGHYYAFGNPRNAHFGHRDQSDRSIAITPIGGS